MRKTILLLVAAMLMCCLRISAGVPQNAHYGQARHEAWTAKYVLTDYDMSIDGNWTDPDYDDSAWREVKGPIANYDYYTPYYETNWENGYTAYWLRRHFTLTEIPESLTLLAIHDDNCEIYLNGNLIYSGTRPISKCVAIPLTPEMIGYFKDGDNVLSAKVIGYGYPDYFDFGFITEQPVVGENALENHAVTERSMPIEFYASEDFGWYASDNAIISNNGRTINSESCLYSTVDIASHSRLSFNYKVFETYDGNELRFYIDDIIYDAQTAEKSGSVSVVLSPGTHELKWSYYKMSSYDGQAEISDIELISTWTTITTETNGQVGKQTIYKFDRLDNPDLNFLKIVGPMGEAEQNDWNDIRNMKNLAGLDLTEARFDYLPEGAFRDMSNLSFVALPEGITSIGANAFYGTQLYDIDIPSSVKSIGAEAFWGTRLKTVNFKEDSQLETIGYSAFANCAYLNEIYMPNTVKTLELYLDDYGYTFYRCSRLERVSLSNGLTSIPRETFHECGQLREITLPDNLESIGYEAFRNCTSLAEIALPETLRSIGESAFCGTGLERIIIPVKVNAIGRSAFSDCSSLQYIELPSYIPSYYYNFSSCKALETVVCKSPTPPVIDIDPFRYGADKSSMTLYVPEFALADYKLDNYWQQFGTILPIDVTLDYWRIAGRLDIPNDHRMGGKPDVDLYYGGKLTVTGSNPVDYGYFQFFAGEENPGSLINRTEAFTTDSVNTVFPVDYNKWYFFTPLYDVKVSDIKHSNASASMAIRYYNAETRAKDGKGGWQDVTSEYLHAGIGYILQTNKSGEIYFPSKADSRSVMFETEQRALVLETNESENAAHKNWNFIGNVYPCYFDIYSLDFTAPITIWEGRNFVAKSITDDDYALRPMQAFFVQKPDEIQNIVFAVSGRLHNATVPSHNNAPARRTADQTRTVFNINIEGNGMSDQTRVVLNEQKTLAYELDCDASKFMSLDAAVPQIFTVNDGTRMAINERPQLDGTVALGVTFGAKGEYTISAARADGEVTLYDSLTGITTDLTQADYTLTVDGACQMTDRLYLNVSAAPSSIVDIDGNAAEVTAVDGGISVKGAGSVTVYSISGIEVYAGTLTAQPTTIAVQSGVYVVRIDNVTYKVIVK